MVFRSEGSLKSEMMSLARTSNNVDNTSVFRLNKTEEHGQLRLKRLTKLDSIVVINSYQCFLIDKIVPVRNQL